MKFDIKCATFVRLASICNFFEPTTPQEIRDKIRTVRLEAVNGNMLAIACNQKIAAIELIGRAPSNQNDVAHVILDPAIINQCKAESFMDGVLTINTIPEIATGMAQTSSGWSFPGNACYWFDETPLNDWRKWAPDTIAEESKYVMYWNLYHVQALMESSPSGKVIFPEFIDTMQPIVLRDYNNPNWVGLFIPRKEESPQKIPAQLPDWWRK